MKLAKSLLEKISYDEFKAGQRKLEGALNILHKYVSSMNRTLDASSDKFKSSQDYTVVGKSIQAILRNLEVAQDVVKSVKGLTSLNVDSEKENKSKLIQSIKNIKLSFDGILRLANKTEDSHMRSALSKLVKEYTDQIEDIMYAIKELKGL